MMQRHVGPQGRNLVENMLDASWFSTPQLELVMFSKGTMREDGIDITLKGNREHVLAPDNWDMVLGVKFGKVSPGTYKKWYADLIRKRWDERREEFMDLAREGLEKDVKLLCYCPKNTQYCHAEMAAKFMNKLVLKLQEKTAQR